MTEFTASSVSTAILNPLLVQDNESLWQGQLFQEFEAGNSHTFILNFNINDYVFTPRFISQKGYAPKRLNDYLGDLLLSRGFTVVLYYSQSRGIRYLKEEMRAQVEAYVKPGRQNCTRFYGQPPDIPARDESELALTYIDKILTCENAKKAGLRVAVILEHLENLTPHEDLHSPGMSAAFITQLLQTLSIDDKLQRCHIIIGLTTDLGHVASSLYISGSECQVYSIGLPTEADRCAWTKLVVSALSGRNLPNPIQTIPGQASTDLKGGEEEVARLTSGFSYDKLRDLIFYAAQARIPLSSQLIEERKRAIISSESRELLEFITPEHDLDSVSGYENVKKYLRIVRDILKGSNDLELFKIVPKGILFLGPPGTGKSYVAAALAKETGFNLVKLKNIRSMWVGESERNLSRVLDLLSSLAPVIVFVDELDAAFGKRSNGAEGDSGVDRRIFQRILEFMAMDEYRGKVLWIAASNRPDGIDAALLSRFDMVIPFLLPDANTRKLMLKESYPAKIKYAFQDGDVDLDEAVGMTQDFSGREMDTICRHAMLNAGLNRLTITDTAVLANPIEVKEEDYIQALREFRQARDLDEYELQTLLAIQSTNFITFLPDRTEIPESVRSEIDSLSPVNEEKLRNRINELRQKQRRS